jgi:hypothetical protein
MIRAGSATASRLASYSPAVGKINEPAGAELRSRAPTQALLMRSVSTEWAWPIILPVCASRKLSIPWGGRSLGYRASWVWLDLRHHPDRKHVFVWLNPI